MKIAAQDLVPLATIKLHLRVEGDSEDTLIELYAESALAWALWYCDNPKLVEPGDFPASFKSALLLLIGHSYANREAIVTGTIAAELPLAVESLLWSSRDWYGPRDEVRV
ncbi:head-tail connector protein [Pseudomonas cremoricolorata]|uniref:Phage gp6-like head-tail connector protein n=1 Tax=Pseudomonas cremoricolorata TaxID=157783 RepID=A0A089WSS8_9PSED|nr:head-tail connector protein [Pseudomonas cremoricolorata]AIR90224.1 hypothetical protein LK03_13380 [Pseudomonas cremoricolorata]